MKNKILLFSAVLMSVCLLAGCIPLILGAGVAGGIVATQDLDDARVSLLRKTLAAKFRRGGHAEDAEFAKTIDHRLRNVLLAIDRRGIDSFVAKLTHLGNGLIDGRLHGRWKLRIRKYVLGAEVPEKHALGEAEVFRTGEQQLLGLFLLLFELRGGEGHRLGLQRIGPKGRELCSRIVVRPMPSDPAASYLVSSTEYTQRNRAATEDSTTDFTEDTDKNPISSYPCLRCYPWLNL